jgi:hypothetical protein
MTYEPEWEKKAKRDAIKDPYGVYDGCMKWLLDEKVKTRQPK